MTDQVKKIWNVQQHRLHLPLPLVVVEGHLVGEETEQMVKMIVLI